MYYIPPVLQENFYKEEISTTLDKLFIVDEVYELLKVAYERVEGGLHFADKDDLVISTDLWRVVYYEAAIVGVIIYKAKRGLKMVAMAINHCIEKRIKRYTKEFLGWVLRSSLAKSWMEVSESLERFILQNGGINHLIPNHLARSLTGKDIKVLSDGYHYQREIQGIIKTKIIIGNVKLKKDSE